MHMHLCPTKKNFRVTTLTSQNYACSNALFYLKNNFFKFLCPRIFAMKTKKSIKPFSILQIVPL